MSLLQGHVKLPDYFQVLVNENLWDFIVLPFYAQCNADIGKLCQVFYGIFLWENICLKIHEVIRNKKIKKKKETNVGLEQWVLMWYVSEVVCTKGTILWIKAATWKQEFIYRTTVYSIITVNVEVHKAKKFHLRIVSLCISSWFQYVATIYKINFSST